MTNVEIQMTKEGGNDECRMSKLNDEARMTNGRLPCYPSSIVLRPSDFLRHLSFDIRHSLLPSSFSFRHSSFTLQRFQPLGGHEHLEVFPDLAFGAGLRNGQAGW